MKRNILATCLALATVGHAWAAEPPEYMTEPEVINRIFHEGPRSVPSGSPGPDLALPGIYPSPTGVYEIVFRGLAVGEAEDLYRRKGLSLASLVSVPLRRSALAWRSFNWTEQGVDGRLFFIAVRAVGLSAATVSDLSFAVEGDLGDDLELYQWSAEYERVDDTDGSRSPFFYGPYVGAEVRRSDEEGIELWLPETPGRSIVLSVFVPGASGELPPFSLIPFRVDGGILGDPTRPPRGLAPRGESALLPLGRKPGWERWRGLDVPGLLRPRIRLRDVRPPDVDPDTDAGSDECQCRPLSPGWEHASRSSLRAVVAREKHARKHGFSAVLVASKDEYCGRMLMTAAHAVRKIHKRSLQLYWWPPGAEEQLPQLFPRKSAVRVVGENANWKRGKADVALVLLPELPAAGSEAWMAGWAPEKVGKGGVMIHYPDWANTFKCHDKRRRSIPQSVQGSRWLTRVPWDGPYLRPGSSGSGIWNQEGEFGEPGRLVGVYHKGASDCGGPGTGLYTKLGYDRMLALLQGYLGKDGQDGADVASCSSASAN